MGESPSQVRLHGSNAGTIERRKTLATAGTAPGHDRTGLEFDMHHRTNEPPPADRVRVRKIATCGCWQTKCPCGFTWHTRHHRLALLVAVEHTHQVA